MTEQTAITLGSFSTADAIARLEVHVPFAELTPEQTAAWSMFRALANVPCTCQHSVPYAPHEVTVPCGRCKSMHAWLELQPRERIVLSTSKAEGAKS